MEQMGYPGSRLPGSGPWLWACSFWASPSTSGKKGVKEMAEEKGKASVPPQKLSKEEIVEWWKKSCVEVGSDLDDLRMSRISTITMFWLFILFGVFLLIALPTVNTRVEVWVTVLS